MKHKMMTRLVIATLTFLLIFTGLPFGDIATPAHAAPGDSEATAIWVDQQSIEKSERTVTGVIFIDKVTSGANMVSIFNLDRDEMLGNVPVFYQWRDQDGTMSPIYKTITKADGKYVILLPDFVDAFGRNRTFEASSISI